MVRFPHGSPSIDEVVLRVARGDGSAEESARVMRWRWESPRNDERFGEIARLLRLAGDLGRAASVPVPARVIVDLARERAGTLGRPLRAVPPPYREGP